MYDTRIIRVCFRSLSLWLPNRVFLISSEPTSSSFSLRYPEPFIFTKYWERSASVCRPIPSFRRIFFQYRGESLSGSRQQQQVVNPFFKGSATGSVWGREGKEKLLRERISSSSSLFPSPVSFRPLSRPGPLASFSSPRTHPPPV